MFTLITYTLLAPVTLEFALVFTGVLLLTLTNTYFEMEDD